MPNSSHLDDLRLTERLVLRPRYGQLVDGNQPIALGGRAFDLLCALAERPGQLVTKRDLIDRVWPDVVVEENNLHVQIATVRKAVGAALIATVPGRGYRLQVTTTAWANLGDAPSSAAATGDAAPPFLVGRDADLDNLHSHVRRERLVTLAGVGGVGKTSLARAMAQAWCQAHAESCVWVELAALQDPELVVHAVALASGTQLPADVGALEGLAQVLFRRSELLVIDNAEHLVAAVAEVVSMLVRRAPSLRMLVTSRQPLQLPEEVVLRLDGLEVPRKGTPPEVAGTQGAVALFVKRARAAEPRFEIGDRNVAAIIEICRKLDGLPLGIEMAAARVPSLGVSGLAQGLSRSRQLLSARGRAASPRHHTLRATFDWSHALLGASEQRTFRRLAVFNGGFTLHAAQQVTGEAGDAEWQTEDALAGLIDHSMIVADGGDPPRFGWLVTVRAYALERLAESGEHSTNCKRHAIWCLAFFAAADDDWWHRPTDDWVAAVLPEMDNLRAAIAWCLRESGDVALGVRLVAASINMWQRLCAPDAEAKALSDFALSHVSSTTDPSVKARLHFGQGLYEGCSDVAAALRSMKCALDMAALGERDRAHALIEHARLLARVGDFDGCAAALDEAAVLCAIVRLPALNGLHSLAQGLVHSLRGHPHEAIPQNERAVESFEIARCSVLAAMARNDVADGCWAAGDVAKAEVLLRQVIAHSRTCHPALGDNTGVPQLNLASVLAEMGDLEAASSWAREALPLLSRSQRLWSAYDCLSLLAALRCDQERAALLHGLSDATYAAASILIREPNEARLHARVRAFLLETMDPEAMQAAMLRGAALDENHAYTMALGELLK